MRVSFDGPGQALYLKPIGQLSDLARRWLLEWWQLVHLGAMILVLAASPSSLVFEPCAAFEVLRADATPAQPPQRAYADYFFGRVEAANIALLPPVQRAAAAGSNAGVAGQASGADALGQLVAAGVLLRTGRASQATALAAASTASRQGWQRPLLAWLTWQAERAGQAGHADELARLERRMALVLTQGQPTEPSAERLPLVSPARAAGPAAVLKP